MGAGAQPAPVRPLASAIPSSSESPLDLDLPGRASGLCKALGIDTPLPRGRVLLEVIRLVHSEPETVRHNQEAPRLRLRSYFLALRLFQEAAAAARPAGGPISLQMAQTRRDRERLQDLLTVMGLRLRSAGKGYALERVDDRKAEERRQLLTAAGVDVEAIQTSLSGGGSAEVVVPSETVPLPLPAPAWSASVFKRSLTGRDLAGAILSDRNAALLYYGLAALDSPTLAFLAGHPETLAQLYEKHAAAFASSGRSLHVRDERVQTPGPPAATRLWEALVGERVDRPGQFISNLFGKDEGRLAFFFDSVAHLGKAGQRFALGALISGEQEQEAHVRALYAAFTVGLQTCVPAVRPFGRVAYDAAQLLSAVRTSDDGEMAPPAWTRLWTEVFRDPGGPDDATKPLEPGDFFGTLSAASLVELTAAVDVNTRRNRSETILFAQRVFATSDARVAPDILVALRGFARYRALLLSLERMGLTDAALMARSVRHAAQLGRVGEMADAGALLAEFQGALAIVERARFARAIDVKTAGDLVGTLVDIAPVVPGQYGRLMARWIESRLLPAFGRVPGGAGSDVTCERAVVLAMAGAVVNGQAGSAGALSPVIRWEDRDYVVDLATADLQRFERLRARQVSNDLDGVLALARATEELSAGVTSMSKLHSTLDELRTIEPRVRRPARVGVPGSPPAPDPQAAIDQVIKEAGAMTSERDLSRVAQIAAPLADSIDSLLSEVLATLAYLPSLGDPEGVTLLVGNVAAQHDFGFTEVRLTVREGLPWAVPAEVSGAGVTWHMVGSLLGLDAALSQLALRELANERVPPVPAIDMNERATLAQTVVLTNPRELSDVDLGAIVEAIGASRRRLGEGSRDGSDLEAWLEQAGVDEWRIRAVEWMIAREPDELPGMLTLVDLFWLSASAGPEAGSLDAFGTAPASLSGRLLTQFPARQSWGTATGREGAGFLSSRFDDLKLRVAEGLADRKLPAALLPAALAVATSDFISEAAPVHRDDFVTMCRQAQQIPASRLDAYIETLTVSGPLVQVNRRKMP